MKNPPWSSKKRRLKRASRNLRALARRHKKTKGFLLLSAIGKAKDGDQDEALREIGRFELVTDDMCSGDRALLQSAKDDLAKYSDSWLLKLLSSALLGSFFKHCFATFWSRIVSKNLIYFLYDFARPSSNFTRSLGGYRVCPAC